MTLKEPEHIDQLKGGINSKDLNRYVEDLLLLFRKDAISWYLGAEHLSDLLALREEKLLPIDSSISIKILDWICHKYDSSLFLNFSGSYTEEDNTSEEIVKTLEFTCDILFQIHHLDSTHPFILKKLQESKNNFEKNLLKWLQERIANEVTITLPNSTLNKIIRKANTFFENENDAYNKNQKLCELKESVTEHDFCYSIGWCLKSEKYISPVKRSSFAGGGPLLISKISSHLEMVGSSPSIDWVKEFELKIRDLESYWSLEFNFDKKHLATYKGLLNINSAKLLKMSRESASVIVEKDEYILRQIQLDFSKAGISSKLELKERKRSPKQSISFFKKISTNNRTQSKSHI